MVLTKSLLLAVTAFFGLAQASPLESRQTIATYKVYKGDGTPAMGWPYSAEWRSFDDLWAINSRHSASACRWKGVVENSAAENAVLRASIHKYAAQTGMDPRYILITVMQESTMCVRQETSISPNEKVRNPGLMQSANGPHTCNEIEAGITLRVPCPDSEIDGMIADGMGITVSWGLRQLVERSGGSQYVSSYYKAATLYNSGVMPPSGLLEHGRSNPCYSSDIANRLMGWVDDKSPCDRKTIGL